MNLKNIIVFVMLVLLLSACQAASSPVVPIPTVNFTSTQVPPTLTPLPADIPVAASPTLPALMKNGGITLGVGTNELILYGYRNGESAATVHVVMAGSCEEIKTQKGIATALNGGGPFLFTFLENQPFKSENGATALANMSLGMTDEPDTYLVVMWTGDISTRFPPDEHFSEQEGSFSYEWDADMELEGWLENGRINLSQPNLPEDQQEDGFNFILFHHAEETFILGFPPGAETGLPDWISTPGKVVVLPPEIAEDQLYGFPALIGQNYSYLVRGFTKGTVSLPLQSGFPIPVPILEVSTIELQK